MEAGGPIVPGLVEFREAGGIRIPAAIVDSPLDSIRIGAPLKVEWSSAVNGKVPVFRIDVNE